MPLAPHVQKYFWDINPKKAKPESHPEYYIKRILEFGDKKSFLWLKSVFGMKKIKEVARSARLSPKSRNFWLRILD
jgi:hypothetical protein